MFFTFKRILRKIYYYLMDEVYLEWILLDTIIFFSLLFGKAGYPIGIIFFIPIMYLKYKKVGFKDSIFTFNLLDQYNENYRFLVFGIINIILALTIIQLDIERFHTFVAIIVFRIIFATENIYIQNFILNNTIEDMYSEGELKKISKLSDKKTIESLQFLQLIKEDVKVAVEKKVETEKLKTELITNISHDLKTPLTSIISYTDILSKKETMDDEAKKYIEILGRNSERLMSLITDLIYASKTGAGNVKVEKSFIDFNELVSQIYGDFDASFQKKDLEFVYTSDNEDIKLYTDGNILSRIIQNLVSNTYKYSMPGTKIYADTVSSIDKIYFTIANLSYKKLDLNDFTVDELMEEMVKTEKSRTTEGSGLGLYITRNLVEILGGKFSIEVEADLFKVYLELNRDN